MTDGGKQGNRGRGGGSAGKSTPRAKPKGKAKGRPKQKRRSNRSTTQKARERAAGLIPNPNFKIIASDPLKAQIVAVALQRLYSPSEYAREADVDLRIASYAFKVLREKGVLELVEAVPVRGSTIKHMYRATEAALVSNADWGELSEALRPVFTGTILQDFSARVTQAIDTGDLFSRDDFCLYWAPRELDEIAWKEQVKIYNWCIEASEQLEVETVNRRASGEDDGKSFHTTFAIAVFPSPTHEEFKKHQAKNKRKRKDQGKTKGKPKCSPAKAKGTAKTKGVSRDKSTKGQSGGVAKTKGKGKGGKA